MAVQPSRGLLTVDAYYRLAESGALRDDAHVELIEGKLVEMPPISPEHANSVDTVADLLRERVGRRARIRVQNPLRLSARTEVQPDVAVVRLPQDRGQLYGEAHPTAADTILVVEIASTSLAFDLGGKALLYARHGVPELWVIDLVGCRVIVHREPTPAGYISVERLERDAAISVLAWPDAQVTIDELLG